MLLAMLATTLLGDLHCPLDGSWMRADQPSGVTLLFKADHFDVLTGKFSGFFEAHLDGKVIEDGSFVYCQTVERKGDNDPIRGEISLKASDGVGVRWIAKISADLRTMRTAPLVVMRDHPNKSGEEQEGSLVEDTDAPAAAGWALVH